MHKNDDLKKKEKKQKRYSLSTRVIRFLYYTFPVVLLFLALDAFFPEIWHWIKSDLNWLAWPAMYSFIPDFVSIAVRLNPIWFAFEVFAILFILWKGIVRGGIVAFLNLKVLLSFLCSLFFSYFMLYQVFDFSGTRLYLYLYYFYKTSSSLLQLFFLPLMDVNGTDYVVAMIPVLIFYFLIYIFLKIKMLIDCRNKYMVIKYSAEALEIGSFKDTANILKHKTLFQKLFRPKLKLYLGNKHMEKDVMLVGNRILARHSLFFDEEKLEEVIKRAASGQHYDVGSGMVGSTINDSATNFYRNGRISWIVGEYYNHVPERNMLCKVFLSPFTLIFFLISGLAYHFAGKDRNGELTSSFLASIYYLALAVTYIPDLVLNAITYVFNTLPNDKLSDDYAVDSGNGVGLYFYLCDIYDESCESWGGIFQKLKTWFLMLFTGETPVAWRVWRVRRRTIKVEGEEYWLYCMNSFIKDHD